MADTDTTTVRTSGLHGCRSAGAKAGRRGGLQTFASFQRREQSSPAFTAHARAVASHGRTPPGSAPRSIHAPDIRPRSENL